jgi:hypothetical protein
MDKTYTISITQEEVYVDWTHSHVYPVLSNPVDVHQLHKWLNVLPNLPNEAVEFFRSVPSLSLIDRVFPGLINAGPVRPPYDGDVVPS